MKRLLLSAAVLTAWSAWVTTTSAELVDFNTAGVLDGSFFHTPAPIPVAEADGVGIGPSRGLSVTGTTDSGYTLLTPSFDFSNLGTTLSVSAFFKTAAGPFATAGEDRIFECILVATNNNVVTGANVGVGGKIQFVETDGIDDIQIEFRRSNADVAASVSPANFDVQPNTWYKATFTAKNNGPSAPVAATMALDNYGANGTALLQANVLTHAFDIPLVVGANDLTPFLSDTEVFGAFRVRNGTRLMASIDNFEVGVPGPGLPPGDVDLDDDVDMDDFNAIKNNFQKTVVDRSFGDLTGDLFVDWRDFRQWKNNFPSPAEVAGLAIPEPAGMMMALVGIFFASASRRRRI